MDQIERERQNRGEVLLRFFDIATGIDALGGKSVEETFSDEDSVRKLIENLSQEQFINLLNGLNGIIRGIKKEDWGMSDRAMEISGLESETVFAPKTEDRSLLFTQMFEAVKKMNQNGRSMEDIALMVSVATNAIHPWEDANGRTSRLTYSLLKQGYTQASRNKIMELMSENGRNLLPADYQGISGDLDQIIRKEKKLEFDNLFSEVPTTEFQFVDGVTDGQKKGLSRAYKAGSSTHLAFAISDFLKSRQDKENYYRAFDGGRNVVMMDKLIPHLNSGDIKEIFKHYDDAVRRKVELLIDCIENPDKPEYQTQTREGDRASLLEKLKDKLKRELK